MRRFAAFLAFVSSIAIVACGPAPEPPAEAQGPTRADTVVMAMQAFDESVFDTVTWESDEVRSERGRLVYNISCSKCHGRHGAGDANFVMQGDTVRRGLAPAAASSRAGSPLDSPCQPPSRRALVRYRGRQSLSDRSFDRW